jgi:hypothetical protein
MQVVRSKLADSTIFRLNYQNRVIKDRDSLDRGEVVCIFSANKVLPLIIGACPPIVDLPLVLPDPHQSWK